MDIEYSITEELQVIELNPIHFLTLVAAISLDPYPVQPPKGCDQSWKLYPYIVLLINFHWLI